MLFGYKKKAKNERQQNKHVKWCDHEAEGSS